MLEFGVLIPSVCVFVSFVGLRFITELCLQSSNVVLQSEDIGPKWQITFHWCHLSENAGLGGVLLLKHRFVMSYLFLYLAEHLNTSRQLLILPGVNVPAYSVQGQAV